MLESKGGLGLLIVFLLLPELFLLGYFSVGHVLAFGDSAPRKSDLIVVLGGGSGERYAKGKSLVVAGFSENFLLLNPSDSEREDASSLRNSKLRIDDLPRNSWQEAKAVRAWMEAYGWKSVIVVSDPPHMLRLRYAWSSVFRNSDLSFSLLATKHAWWSAATWWSNPQSNAFVESEILKLGYYILYYRFGIF